jgi:large subunit ribosomal protein L13
LYTQKADSDTLTYYEEGVSKVKNIRMYKTYVAKPGEVERKWYVVDATDQTLGRLATQIATILRGKHKPEYTPHEDVGDFVVVVNAEKVHVTGRKLDQKKYYWHTGFPGGIREITLSRQLELHPERVIEHAVKGMLPRGPLGRRQLRKLRVYEGAEHPHVAQQPEPLVPNER